MMNFVFLMLFFESLRARWDLISTIDVLGGNGYGHWKGAVDCPDGSWVRGFRHKTSQGETIDDVGTVMVEISCYDLNGNKVSTLESNSDNIPSNADWSNYAECSGSFNFIIGLDQKVGDNSIAVTGARIKCADKSTIRPGHEHNEGSFQGYSDCPDQSSICGIEARYADYEGAYDDSALNDLKINCCRTCEQSSGRYVDTSTKLCSICHYTCKTCSAGGTSDCLSCYHSGSPVSNACPSPNYLFEKEGSAHSPSGWTGSPSTTLSDCGNFNTGIFGGYNVFGSGAYAQKSYSSIPPHFKKRIRVRFVKIDTWDNEYAQVYLDSTQIISKQFAVKDSLLVRNPCGMGEFVYDYVLEAEITNSLQSFLIKITTDLSEGADNESWGFSDFYLAVLKCDSTCFTCTDQNANSCLSCYPNAAKSSGACSCNDQYYMVVTSNCVTSPCSTCNPCYTGCKKCTGPNQIDCQSCIPDYYFSGGKCHYKSCPGGLYGNNATLTCDNACAGISEYLDTSDNICKACDPTCLTCSEKLYTNCRSCAAPRFLSTETPNADGQCINPCILPRFAHYPTRRCWTLCPVPSWGRISDRICYDECQSTTEYKDLADRICKSCHASCLTCSGPTDSDCKTCGGSLYLYGSKCLSDCGEGKYGDSSSKTCLICDSNCRTCTTPDQPTNCLSCKASWFLKNNVCINPNCASNEYKNFDDNSCKPCHSSCLTCSGGSANDCISCSGSLCFYEPNHSCISNCPSPYYAYSIYNKCYKTCPLISTTTPLYGRNNSRTCASSCENLNEFADPSDRICRTCNSECKTCNGLTNSDCLNCDSNRYYKNKQCVLDCGSGFYGDSTSHTCLPCQSPCQECKPDGPDKCTKCSSSNSEKYLDKSTDKCLQICLAPLWGRNDMNECYFECAAKHYGDPADRVCKKCDSSCLTCDDKGCINCPSGLFLYMKACISPCPTNDGYWGNSDTNECVKCDATCNTCYGSLQNNCKSCLLPLKLLGSSCIAQCPQSPKIMYVDFQLIKCVENCQEGYYPDKESQTCLKCHSSCKNCTKGSSSDCGGCVIPKIFNPSLGTCSDECSKGYFKEKIAVGLYSTNCSACDYTCTTCVDYKEKCLSCAAGYYPFYNAVWLCVPCTLVQQFVDPSDRLCKFCNVAFCSVCKSMDLCNSCIDGYYVSASTDRDFCLEKIKVRTSLVAVKNPKLFKLAFSDDWDEFFENFNSTLKISIDSIVNDGFHYAISSSGRPKEFYIEFQIRTKIAVNSRMTIVMSPDFKSERSKFFQLLDKSLFVFLDEYIPCETHQYWNWVIKGAFSKLNVVRVGKDLEEKGSNGKDGESTLEPNQETSINPSNDLKILPKKSNSKGDFKVDLPNESIESNDKQQNRPMKEKIIVVDLEANDENMLGNNHDASVLRKNSQQISENKDGDNLSGERNAALEEKKEETEVSKFNEKSEPEQKIETVETTLQDNKLLVGEGKDDKQNEGASEQSKESKQNRTVQFNENPEEENDLSKKRSSFVNLWDMLRKKKEQPKKPIENKRKESIKPAARKSVLNQVWERITRRNPTVTEAENEKKASPESKRKSFTEMFFGKSKQRKSKAPLSGNSVETENLVSRGENLPEDALLNRQNTRKSQVSGVQEFDIPIKKDQNKEPKEREKEDDEEEEDKEESKNEEKLKKVHLIGKAVVTKFGRKTLGKLNPWEEGQFQTADTAGDDKKDVVTKFGRKSRGKITPWDEISYPSEIFRASIMHFGEVLKNMRTPLTGKEMNERYKIFSRDLKLHSSFQRNFMAFDLLRQIIIVISLLSLEEWPLSCVSIITTTSTILVILITVLRPYESLKNNIQTLFNELCLLMACIGALALASLDRINEQDLGLRMNLGWVIVYSNMVLIYFFMAMSLLDLGRIIASSVGTVRKYYELKYTTGLSVHQKKKRREKIVTKI